MYSRGEGVGTLTLFHTTKICDFPTLFLPWTTVLKKRNEKRLILNSRPLYQTNRKKNVQYFDLSD